MNVLICHNEIYNKIYNNKNKDLNFSLIDNDFNYKITINDSLKKYYEQNDFETTIIEIKRDYSLDNLKFIRINNYNIGIFFLKEPIEEFIKILEKDLGTNTSDNVNKK